MNTTKKPKLKKFKLCIIQGKRWFSRTYSNTYHSVIVTIDQETVLKSGIHYGYGDGYLQTAYELLKNAGYMPNTGETYPNGYSKDWDYFCNDRRENRKKYFITVADVPRERDLKN